MICAGFSTSSSDSSVFLTRIVEEGCGRDPSRIPIRRDPRTAGKTCARHTRKLPRLSFSETGMLRIVEAIEELIEAMSIDDEKLQCATRCSLWRIGSYTIWN